MIDLKTGGEIDQIPEDILRVGAFLITEKDDEDTRERIEIKSCLEFSQKFAC